MAANTSKIRKMSRLRVSLEHASDFYSSSRWIFPGKSLAVDLYRYVGVAEIDYELIVAGGFQLWQGFPRTFCVPVDRFDAFVEALKAADALARIEAPRARIWF